MDFNDPQFRTRFSATHAEYSPSPARAIVLPEKIIQPSAKQGGARRGVPKRRRLSLFVPKKTKVKRGRKPLWNPRAATDADRLRGEALLKEWGMSKSSATRVIKDFGTFCDLSGLEKNGTAMVPWVGQMSEVLQPGTLETYAMIVKKTLPRDPMAYQVVKCLQRQHADADTKHAVDMGDADLWQVVLALPEDIQPAGAVMCLGGFRGIALRFFRRNQVVAWHKSEDKQYVLHVQVRVDKNANKRVHRAELSIPRSWGIPTLPSVVYEYLLGVPGNQGERLFRGMTNARMNNALAKATQSLGLPTITSTSFRRAFMNRVFRECEGDEARIATYTLHHSKYVTRAHYCLWKGEGRPPNEHSDDEDSAVDEEEDE